MISWSERDDIQTVMLVATTIGVINATLRGGYDWWTGRACPNQPEKHAFVFQKAIEPALVMQTFSGKRCKLSRG